MAGCFFFFFSFSFFRIPNICFFFFKLLLALIATSFLNVNENFLWFFLCSIFFELLFKTEQKSVVIKCQHLIEYTGSNQILSNVWFLTMEENSFALVNAKKSNKKQKIILYQRMACSIFSLSKLTPPQFPPTHFTNKIIACLEGHFIVTPSICFNESPLKTMFVLKIFKLLSFVMTFWVCRENDLIRKIRLISKLRRNLVNKELQCTYFPLSHELIKGNQILKFGQVKQYNKRDFFSKIM